MSVRTSAEPAPVGAPPGGSELETAIQAMQPVAGELAEGNDFSVASSAHPLKREMVVTIRATLNELCLQKSKGVWAPSADSLKSIFRQRRFTSLDGTAEAQGDLKSVVLHDLSVGHVKSTFPVALGAKITGVDDKTFSITGEAYSTIVLPHAESTVSKSLQADDVSLAYEFSKKFPGYTSENLAEKGVHEVAQRRFVLVSADHPIVSAISENADKLQVNEISMMPEGLVKISQSLYDSILPLVKAQVQSQIKVRDFSKATVSLCPAEYSSWSDCRTEMMLEAKRPLQRQLQAELSSCAEDEAEGIRAAFASREAALEHEIDFRPMNFSMNLGISYNFLSGGSNG